MNKLLLDAIADAKAVRETAMASAKAALEEAFAPKLQSMLSHKIKEEMEEDETVDPNAAAYGADQGTELEARMKELAGISEEDEDSEGEMDSEEEPMDSEEDMDSDGDMGDEDMGGEEEYEEEEETEEEPMDDDLAEILRELEHEEEETEEKPMDEELDLDEVIAALREEEEETEEEPTDEEVDLNELLNSLNEEEEEEEDATMEGKGMKHKMKKMEEELNEAYNAVKFLRSKLSEVNLLNAKLLYVNKLFRNNLTETQKVKIIETFDRAKTVREAKLVYSTLAESLSSKTTATKVTTKKAVMEGLASAATKKTTVITEGNDQVNRFKKLAGLI